MEVARIGGGWKVKILGIMLCLMVGIGYGWYSSEEIGQGRSAGQNQPTESEWGDEDFDVDTLGKKVHEERWKDESFDAGGDFEGVMRSNTNGKASYDTGSNSNRFGTVTTGLALPQRHTSENADENTVDLGSDSWVGNDSSGGSPGGGGTEILNNGAILNAAPGDTPGEKQQNLNRAIYTQSFSK